MKAQRVVNCWDYHHGQSTRILVSGFAPVPGNTMSEKQDYFQKNLDNLRAALLQEPRGHRNMLGAILTDPVNPGSLAGVLFTSPHGFGYFDMCGDSSLSLGSYLVDAGIVEFENGSGNQTVLIDTVAGTIELELESKDGALVGVTMGNVPSRFLGTTDFNIPGYGSVTAEMGYGGLVYAFVSATSMGLDTLDFSKLDGEGQRRVIAAGSALLNVAHSAKGENPIDLVTLIEAPVDGVSKVANFYSTSTMGRTPSGTGLSARLAVEHAQGRLAVGERFSQQSAVGLQFHGVIDEARENESGVMEVVPKVTAVSHLMSISQIVFKEDDPFVDGFVIQG